MRPRPGRVLAVCDQGTTGQFGRRGAGPAIGCRWCACLWCDETADQLASGWSRRGLDYCSSFRMACGAEFAWASTEVAAEVRICAWLIAVTSVARSASVMLEREAVTF